jgi:hypothetical protein
VLQAAEREARAWALHCALAPTYAETEEGREQISRLWEALTPPEPADPAAEAAAIEQAQAQARLDGLVRQVKVSRDE